MELRKHEFRLVLPCEAPDVVKTVGGELERKGYQVQVLPEGELVVESGNPGDSDVVIADLLTAFKETKESETDRLWS